MINYFKVYTVCLFLLFFTPKGFAQQESQNFNEILSEANKLSSKGNYDEALGLYEAAVKVIPDTISTIDRIKLYNSLTKKIRVFRTI